MSHQGLEPRCCQIGTAAGRTPVPLRPRSRDRAEVGLRSPPRPAGTETVTGDWTTGACRCGLTSVPLNGAASQAERCHETPGVDETDGRKTSGSDASGIPSLARIRHACRRVGIVGIARGGSGRPFPFQTRRQTKPRPQVSSGFGSTTILRRYESPRRSVQHHPVGTEPLHAQPHAGMIPRCRCDRMHSFARRSTVRVAVPLGRNGRGNDRSRAAGSD